MQCGKNHSLAGPAAIFHHAQQPEDVRAGHVLFNSHEQCILTAQTSCTACINLHS